MTSIDTNVIIRYLVGDDATQAEAARALLDGLTPEDPGYICREVAMEVAWVLERSYGFARAQVAKALMDMTSSDSLLVENPDDVVASAHRYRQGGVGFSDLMILSAAKRARATPLYTFDRRLARMEGAALVGDKTGGASS
ncbi:MAG: type II toxin-antitoxin system VapC family toxin [Chloroflexi bacterium]|nr:type II toxin-antitoxin system VapC family toxin [Chloroflexota bacterium]